MRAEGMETVFKRFLKLLKQEAEEEGEKEKLPFRKTRHYYSYTNQVVTLPIMNSYSMLQQITSQTIQQEEGKKHRSVSEQQYQAVQKVFRQLPNGIVPKSGTIL